jgi:hypothetical protein
MKISPSLFFHVLVVAGMFGPGDLWAESVVWTAGDGNWDDQANWSPQRVPGATDDVTIPAGPTVLLNNGGYGAGRVTAAGSLQCYGSLTIEPVLDGQWVYHTRLQVANGGEIGGSLTMRRGTALWSAGGMLSVTGATDLQGANLWAGGGSTLDMAGLTTYTPEYSSYFSASDAGTYLDLSNLATIAPPATSWRWMLDISGEHGAYVKTGPLAMDAATAQSGELGFYAYNPGTVMDITAMPSMPQGMTWGMLEAADGGTIKIANTFTSLDNQILWIGGDGHIVREDDSDAVPHFTSFANGWLTVTERNVPGQSALGSPDFARLSNISGTKIDVFDGGELLLPAVTEITVGENGSDPLDEGLFYMVGTGSRLDLSAVTQIRAIDGWNSYLQANGGSLIDLSGVTEIPAGGFFDVNAWDDGTVIDFSSVTKIHSPAWIVVEPGAKVILGNTVEFTAGDNTIDVYEGGSLVMDGLAVGEGALLEASGVLSSDLINKGTLAPGQSPGTLQVNNYTQAATGKLQVEITGTAPGAYDVLQVNGHAQLDGLLELLVNSALEIEPTMEFYILRSNSLSGIFNGLEEGAVVWSELGGDGDRLFISYRNNGVMVTGSQVPEPSSIALLASLAPVAAAVGRKLHKRRTACASRPTMMSEDRPNRRQCYR